MIVNKIASIKKQDGTVIQNIRMEHHTEGNIYVCHDLNLPVIAGDYILTKKMNGRNKREKIIETCIDVIGGSMDGRYQMKGMVIRI
jgi:hypothetical protein